jgi:hypothetical protein
VAGRLVAEKRLTPVNGRVEFDGVELSRLAAGCYFVELGPNTGRFKVLKVE